GAARRRMLSAVPENRRLHGETQTEEVLGPWIVGLPSVLRQGILETTAITPQGLIETDDELRQWRCVSNRMMCGKPRHSTLTAFAFLPLLGSESENRNAHIGIALDRHKYGIRCPLCGTAGSRRESAKR